MTDKERIAQLAAAIDPLWKCVRRLEDLARDEDDWDLIIAADRAHTAARDAHIKQEGVIEAHKSMDAHLKHAHHAIHTLRAALRPLASSGISIKDVDRAQLAMMETEGFPFEDSYIPLVLESLETPRTNPVQEEADRG